MKRALGVVAGLCLAAGVLTVVPGLVSAGDSGLPVSAVTASGDDGNVPENAVDGDLSTRWSDEGDGVWIRFDLGSAVTVGSVDIAWYKGDSRVETFDVQVSADGSSWTTVVDGTHTDGSTAELRPYDFADVSGRYVRVVGHGNTDNDWTSVSEAVVHGVGGASPTTSPTAGPGDCRYPADVLDLSNWYEGLPIGDDGEPKNVYQPELATYHVDPWFTTTEDCSGVRFRAAVNGVTTSGSSYPRSELREMNGDDKASWSSTEGTHTMVIKEAVTHEPNDKPQVVAGQIHGSDDDISVFRLEGSSLYVTNGDDSNYKLVTDDYTLGTPFEAKFVVSDGTIKAYYNGDLVTTLSKDFDGAYFKAGAYTQANCDKSDPCSDDNYGEVIIYDLTVTHG